MTPAQLTTQLQQETIKQVSIQHQYEAIMKLYEAATMMDNRPLMVQYRMQLHDLLDLKLDVCHSISELSRQLIRSA
jgi:hypothetical protein